MLARQFWPFAEEVRCVKCGEPVPTVEAVAVVNGDQLAGMAHEVCPNDVFEDVDVKDGLL